MSLYDKIKNVVLDTVFPITCVGCGKAKTFACDDCLHDIPIHTDHICFVCNDKPTSYGQSCSDCLGKSSLDGLLVASSYRNAALSKIIHVYKYRFVRNLDLPLSQLLIRAIERSEIPLPDFLCPVPLHPWRLRWRGFNQSELLARSISTRLIPQFALPILQGLVRTRFTRPQMSIEDKNKRHANIRDAFAWNVSAAKKSGENVRGKYIWLIDDVATTSATLEECAAILKQNGAKKVFGVVLAR